MGSLVTVRPGRVAVVQLQNAVRSRAPVVTAVGMVNRDRCRSVVQGDLEERILRGIANIAASGQGMEGVREGLRGMLMTVMMVVATLRAIRTAAMVAIGESLIFVLLG